MKFQIEDIIEHAKGGWASVAVYRSYNQWVSPEIDYPDEWFHVLVGYEPRIGKKHGTVYLSRAGFLAFEQDLKAAFQQSNNQQLDTWDKWKAAIEVHYATVEKQRQRLIKKHQKLLEELQNFNV